MLLVLYCQPGPFDDQLHDLASKSLDVLLLLELLLSCQVLDGADLAFGGDLVDRLRPLKSVMLKMVVAKDWNVKPTPP